MADFSANLSDNTDLPIGSGSFDDFMGRTAVPVVEQTTEIESPDSGESFDPLPLDGADGGSETAPVEVVDVDPELAVLEAERDALVTASEKGSDRTHREARDNLVKDLGSYRTNEGTTRVTPPSDGTDVSKQKPEMEVQTDLSGGETTTDGTKVLDDLNKGKNVSATDLEMNQAGTTKRDIPEAIDPFGSSMTVNAGAEKQESAAPEKGAERSSPVMASNLNENTAYLTVSSSEACPTGVNYVARIVIPGQMAVLFAVTPEGDYLPILTLNRKFSGEDYDEFFNDQPALDGLIYNVTASAGYTPTVSDFHNLGGRPMLWKVPVHEAIQSRIKSGIDNVTATMNRDDEELANTLNHSLRIAVMEMIKRNRHDVPNVLRDELVDRLRALGIVDAAHVVDNAFADTGLQFATDLIKRTTDLSKKGVDVRNEAAENADKSRFREDREYGSSTSLDDRKNHEVSAALSEGSIPLAGFHAAANPAPHEGGESSFSTSFGHLFNRAR